jgi:hypothetical protein
VDAGRNRSDLRLFFAQQHAQPDFREPPILAHGRIESRAIRTSARLNDYLVPDRKLASPPGITIHAA